VEPPQDMTSLSDQSLTLKMLEDFYREVMAPDIRRIFAESESQLLVDWHRIESSISKKVESIETNVQEIKSSVRRIEDRLERMGNPKRSPDRDGP
jgi:hypothetical protein